MAFAVGYVSRTIDPLNSNARALVGQIDERKHYEATIGVCFYIQAKNADTASSAFHKYIKTTGLNP